MTLTETQQDAVVDMHDNEVQNGFVGILSGPPSSGKTEVISHLITDRECVRVSNYPIDVNIVICHHSVINDWKDRLSSYRAHGLLKIDSQRGIQLLREKMTIDNYLCILCTDNQVDRVFDNLHKRAHIQRIIIDNPRCLKLRSRPYPETHATWFITSTPDSLWRQSLYSRSDIYKSLQRAFYDEDNHIRIKGLQRLRRTTIFYREIIPSLIAKTVLTLINRQQLSLAYSCFPGQNVRTNEIDDVFQPNVTERLREPCPICYEDHPIRLVSPCCEQNICAICLAKQTLSNPVCPMCREPIILGDWTLISNSTVKPLRSMIDETKTIIDSCLSEVNNPKVLIVAGNTIYNSIHDIMFCVDKPYVNISGNHNTISKRMSLFQQDPNKIATIVSYNLHAAPIRFNRVTHVILIGEFSEPEMQHWSTRGFNPVEVNIPKIYRIRSVSDILL